jgi:hypothetical protein
MAQYPFIKAWSAGSDVILFTQGLPVGEQENLPLKQLCQRSNGIGGEALVVLEMREDHPYAAPYSAQGEFSWNAIFAAAKYSFETGLYSQSNFELHTPKGPLRINPLDSYFYQYFPHLSLNQQMDRKTLEDHQGQKIAGYLSEDRDFFYILQEDDSLQPKKQLKGVKRANGTRIQNAYALRPLSPEEVELIADKEEQDLTALAQTLAPTLLQENWLDNQFSLKTSRAEIIISKLSDSLSLAAPTHFIFEGNIEL